MPGTRDTPAVAPKTSRDGPVRDPWSRDGRALIDAREAANNQTERQGAETPAAPRDPQRVVVTEFAVPFGSMVLFGIKLVLAAVPALVLLMLIVAGLFAIAGTLLGGAIITMATSFLSQALSWIGWPW